ncbi:TPA: hypothetical protein KOX39_003434 [Clostridioides difficile]|nr:hypothetical protein [Clostridioides difficile]
MRIQTKGKTSITKVSKLIKDIVAETLAKANLDTDVKFKLEDFACDIVFNIDGIDQKITVNHNGLDEVFTMAVALDKKGNIDRTVDNAERSFIDPYVRQEMTGEAMVFETIESEYTPEQLKTLDVNEHLGVKEVISEIIGTDKHLVQYYKDNNLVGELVLEK